MKIARTAGLVLSIAGLALIGRGMYDVAGGKIYQQWRGRQLDRALETIPAEPAPQPNRISYAIGSAIGRLEIPRLALSVVVLEGSDTDTLRLGVGRLHNSSLPGEPGNVVLAGHRDTFFRSLREIHRGDRISLRTPQGTFPYTVDWTQVVDPKDVGVLQPTPAPALTLVTCYPFYYIGSAPQRFIVRAVPAGATPSIPSPAAAPPPPPAPPPARRAAKPKAVVAVASIVEVPLPPAPRHGIKRAFHKLSAVFSSGRAKMQ